ncbi:MAG: thermonuclease family protein [Thermomicrobiales bacterium]
MSLPYDDNRYVATVLSHHDGDTSHVQMMLGADVTVALTVRWYGINSPELATPEGKDALAYLNGLLPPGTEVLVQSVKSGKEKYGRYLAKIWPRNGEGLTYGQQMIDAGHAVAYFGGAR